MKDKYSSLVKDFSGGLSGAIAVLPQTIGLSVLLFTTMGFNASAGAMAGLIGALILLVSSGLAGATIGMISAPNGPVTILLSGLVIGQSNHYAPHEMLIILSAVLFFTGLFQVAFGLLKGGELIKLIPFPVVASMITAIGILMIKSQIKEIIPTGMSNPVDFIPLFVAGLTLLMIFLFKKFTPRLPDILMGLISGVLFYDILMLFVEDPDPEWVMGALPAMDFGEILGRFHGIDLLNLPWELIISSALALSILVMIDCLLTALVADSQTTMRHNARKELVAQGIAQMLIGIVGGVGGGGTKGSTLANTMAGGRRWSPLFAALIILLMTLFGRGVGVFLPLSALSGVIIFIGLNMINLNIIHWIKGKYTRADAVNAIIVITATLLLDVTKAVAIGMAFSVITYFRKGIKRSLIRRQTTLSEYPSPRKWSERHRRILQEHGDKGLLIELQGDLFFATTDRLYRSILKRMEGKKIIILHFRRVLSIDMSGVVLLMQLVDIAEKNGTEIVFTHLHKHLGFGRKMKKAFAQVESKKEKITEIFHSTARALEYAENIILKSEYKDQEYNSSSPVNLEENDLWDGMNEHEKKAVRNISIQKKYSDRDIIISNGEYSGSLFLVTRGFAEQRLYNGEKSYKVLTKYSPGTYFGETTFLNPGPSALTVVAQGETELYEITRDDIDNLSSKEGYRFLTEMLFSIGRKLSKETKKFISEIHRLESL
ncbi:SLC26A/SulP transporter family protein [Spirochaeta isovalerica]|uniref:SulP family sulfate permease n=1 Tax=Spirochaeta isovalerica TaxID=150 RepID=A0A841RB41_9SPIO|nr:SulP family inorganic anion transporter [Spirochaeta isovalerica]MBB6481175.1 SulP family sulfate permease [Spirochaeta isovalerica]